jgi:phosphoserine phosphatase
MWNPSRRFGTVVFDCDSTLSAVEGIEELAGAHREEIARLTDAAMRGEIPLEKVYGRRLAIVRPTRARIEALGRRYVETFVPDAREVVHALRAEGLVVRVLTGGLLPALDPLLHELGLSRDDVAAVDLRFDAAGDYEGFDEASPLARSGGKLLVLRAWAPSLRRPVLLIGDGATDLEARPAADAFVAFAGVVQRPAVIAAADVVIRARSLAPVLPLALGDAPPRDPASSALFARGLDMLSADSPDLLKESR